MAPKKIDIDLLQRVKEHVHKGSYVLVGHAILRKRRAPYPFVSYLAGTKKWKT